ncbi:DUF1851 domain-containing protein [Chitinophaga ginsengisegetis]|uniref:T6SS immunity protein Tdi1 domain-containing protein n=1 Tax=Chitinophaga ginsengisegetis TaxID=393003 RepID=UPI000DB93EC6|nr:T6SS immunity protein Tdi1 domain-containing protein [Chitinophaga ginsengisegetis]MDR6569942.1 hypothetical protein [Chitinophaga ginsengisegetis]MDR6649675.1 hypothetical protein [Chitinophaga ginsengisegetis]MDR6656122.1 hypothetical protein [Chitinophaga ginsengisegetis]
MFETFLAECGPLQNKTVFEQDYLTELKGTLPDDVLSLLARGKGSYMNGYFWIVNPIEYQDILEEVYKPVERPSTCFARDAFGGLYVWEGESIVYIDVRLGASMVLGRKTSVFFNRIITDWEYLSEQLHLENFYPVKEILGDLSSDECYGYVPLLALGGNENVENLQRVKIKEHLVIIAQTAGKIG